VGRPCLLRDDLRDSWKIQPFSNLGGQYYLQRLEEQMQRRSPGLHHQPRIAKWGGRGLHGYDNLLPGQ
jgi:hypothetical protein